MESFSHNPGDPDDTLVIEDSRVVRWKGEVRMGAWVLTSTIHQRMKCQSKFSSKGKTVGSAGVLRGRESGGARGRASRKSVYVDVDLKIWLATVIQKAVLAWVKSSFQTNGLLFQMFLYSILNFIIFVIKHLFFIACI